MFAPEPMMFVMDDVVGDESASGEEEQHVCGEKRQQKRLPHGGARSESHGTAYGVQRAQCGKLVLLKQGRQFCEQGREQHPTRLVLDELSL